MTPYRLTRDALDDLDALWEYIAVDNIDAADRVVADIFHACEHLAESPGIGHTREDLTDHPLRFWSVGRYLVIYRYDRRPIDIVGVLHSARDVSRILLNR